MPAIHKASDAESAKRVAALRDNPLLLGWVVGIVEGECTIDYLRKRLRVAVAMTDLDVLERLFELLGGAVYSVAPQEEHYQEAWRWVVHNEAASELVQILLPHFHSRRKEEAVKTAARYTEYRQSKYKSDVARIENGLAAAASYLRSEGSFKEIGGRYGISYNTVRDYVLRLRSGEIQNPSLPPLVDWEALAKQKTFTPASSIPVFHNGKISTALYKASAEESLASIAHLSQMPLQLGWLAGLFEGEGSVLLSYKRRLTLKIEMTDLDILATVHSLVGGNVYKTAKRKAHYKQAWVWKVDNDIALKLVNTLLPYLGVRRTECATEFSKLYVNYRTEKDSAALLRVKRGFEAATEYLKLEGKESLKAVGVRYGLSESNVHKYVQRIRAGELPPV